MKYVSVPIGMIASIYLATIFAFPFVVIWTKHIVAKQADSIEKTFVSAWNTRPDASMGKILTAHVAQVHPWVNASSLGAFIRMDIVMERWKGFLEIDVSAENGGWRVNKVERGEKNE